MDSFPTEIYFTFWDKVAAQFTQMTTHVMYQTISVILNSGTSGESPTDYRPTSLINCDNQIIKLIRMTKVLPDLTSNKQGLLKIDKQKHISV